MQPRKAVKTLQGLSLAASSELVLHSCKRIEAEVSSDMNLDLPFDSDEYKNAVETLGQHLRSFIAPLHWERFFNIVLELYKKEKYTTLDEITLYSVFVFNGVYLNTFTMPSLSEEKLMLGSRRVEFWKKFPAMLSNLRKVDLTRVKSDQIVEAFCQSCTKLEVISLSGYTPLEPVLQLLIENCKKLKEIHRVCKFILGNNAEPATILRASRELKHLEIMDCCYSNNIMENENTDRKLKLRKLLFHFDTSKDTTKQVEEIAKLFPELGDLKIFYGTMKNEVHRNEVFQALAFSSLKISKLSLQSFRIELDVFDEFLSAKGSFITDLSLNWCEMIGTPRSLLEMLSKCPNLTAFTAFNLRGLKANHLATSTLDHQTLFPNLENIEIVNHENPNLSVSLATKIIEHSQKVSTLMMKLNDSSDYLNEEDELTDLEEPLKILFTSPMVRQLTKLELSCGSRMKKVSGNLVRQVIESCPIMTSNSLSEIQA